MLTTVIAGRVFDFSHSVGRNAAAGDGFSYPSAIALASQGVMYVVSRGNETNYGSRVTKVYVGEPGEEKVLAEFCRYGANPGQALWPNSVAVDSQGRVYVSDDWLNRIAVFDPDGEFIEQWGRSGNGPGQFDGPAGLAFDAEDRLHVVDSRNHRVQVYTVGGEYVAGWGAHGSGPDQLDTPWGIHIAADGAVYVADWKNGRVQKRDHNGQVVLQFGQPGDGPGDLNHPTDVDVDPDGDVYVTDWGNHKLRIFRSDGDLITSLIGDAQWLSKWGQQSIDANPDMAKMRRRVKSLEPEWRFYYPTAVAFDLERDLIVVADCQRGRLQIYKKDRDYAVPQANL